MRSYPLTLATIAVVTSCKRCEVRRLITELCRQWAERRVRALLTLRCGHRRSGRMEVGILLAERGVVATEALLGRLSLA